MSVLVGIQRLACSAALLLIFSGCAGTIAPTAMGSTETAVSPTILSSSSKHTLFVAAFLSDSISVLDGDSNKNPPPFETITAGISIPSGLAVASGGALFVANSAANDVTEYAAGQTVPRATLSLGINAPTAVAVDPSGTLAVANSGGLTVNTVLEFRRGSHTASISISCAASPVALAYDGAGNLYIGDLGTSGQPQPSRVYEVARGSASCTNLGIIGINNLAGIAVDAAENLWVADRSTRTIYSFARGAKHPRAFRISDVGFPVAIAFDSPLQNLYIANFDGGAYRLPYDRSFPLIGWIDNQFSAPIAVAVWSRS